MRTGSPYPLQFSSAIRAKAAQIQRSDPYCSVLFGSHVSTQIRSKKVKIGNEENFVYKEGLSSSLHVMDLRRTANISKLYVTSCMSYSRGQGSKVFSQVSSGKQILRNSFSQRLNTCTWIHFRVHTNYIGSCPM